MSKFPYTPMDAHLLVERVDVSDEQGLVKIGNLFVKQEEDTEWLGGIVIAVGDWVENLPIGTRVYFSKYSGIDVRLEGKDYVILKYEEILLRKDKVDG